jgi:hypothetical protein
MIVRRFLNAFIISFLLFGPFAIFASGSDSDFETPGLGYLTAPSMSLGHFLRPSTLFLPPECLRKGEWNFDIDFNWANVWNYDAPHFLIDCELIRSDQRVYYALEDGLIAGLSVPVIGRTSGFADSFIEHFHQTFHLDNELRNQFPRNRSIIEIINEDGEHIVLARGDCWGIGDISAFAAWQVIPACRYPFSLALHFQLYAPTGEVKQLRGFGKPAVATGAIITKPVLSGRLIGFVGGGYFYSPADRVEGTDIELSESVYTLLAGCEVRVRRNLSILVQALMSSPVTENYYAFASPSNEISSGIKWQIAEHSILEFGILENIIEFRNSPDFGFHLSLGKRL